MELLETPNGPFLVIARAGGTLSENAESRFRAAALSGAEFIYADEAYRSADDKLHPFYKPDWSPQTLLSVNYIGCPIAVQKRLFEACGGLRLLSKAQGESGAYDESALYAFTLRAASCARGVFHIPELLFCGPRPEETAYTDAVRLALTRAAACAVVKEGLYKGSFTRSYGLRAGTKLAIVVLCENADTDALRRTLERIRAAHGVVECEYVIAHEPGSCRRFLRYARSLEESGAARRVCACAGENPARLYNLAAQETHADALLFMPAGAYPQRVETLERMLTLALLPGSGAIGGKLLDTAGRILSAGLVCGINEAPCPLFGGYADSMENPLQNFYTNCIRNTTAINGVLMIASDRFFALSGFDETLPKAGYMEELCVRLTDHKLHNIYTPYAPWRGVEQTAERIPTENRERIRDVFYRFLREGDGMLSRNPSVLQHLRAMREQKKSL